MQPNGLEADGHVARDAERAAQVELSRDRDLDPPGRHSHRGRHHLAGDLGARRERAQEEVARTRRGPRASDARVRLGFVRRAPDVDRARDRRIHRAAVRGQGDA